jgi:hypothetical protein
VWGGEYNESVVMDVLKLKFAKWLAEMFLKLVYSESVGSIYSIHTSPFSARFISPLLLAAVMVQSSK